MDAPLEWPNWWNWEVEFTSHLIKRMLDRQFNEVDLRTMLADASGYAQMPDGRSIVFTQREGHPWEVVVEPDATDRVLLVITAYPKD